MERKNSIDDRCIEEDQEYNVCKLGHVKLLHKRQNSEQSLVIIFTSYYYCCYCLIWVENWGYIFLSLPLYSKLYHPILPLDNFMNRYGLLGTHSFKTSHTYKNPDKIKILIPYLIQYLPPQHHQSSLTPPLLAAQAITVPWEAVPIFILLLLFDLVLAAPRHESGRRLEDEVSCLKGS